MKAIIFLNGDKADVSKVRDYIDNETLIIGCDGGTHHALSLGFTPNVVLGDMDSIESELKTKLAKKNVEFVSFPTKKDYTDAELALSYAVDHGCKEIIFTGILGTRIDHILATIFMLANEKWKTVDIQIIEGNQTMYLVRKNFTFAGKKGDVVSLIPITEKVTGVKTKNLEYQLENKTLFQNQTLGVSNIMTNNTAEISLSDGILLLIYTTL